MTKGAPANNGYKPGFTGAMMTKDTRLAVDAGMAAGVPLPLGAQAQQLFQLYGKAGMGDDDMSGIIRLLQPDLRD